MFTFQSSDFNFLFMTGIYIALDSISMSQLKALHIRAPFSLNNQGCGPLWESDWPLWLKPEMYSETFGH